MDISKLAAWNWFKKEKEREGSALPGLAGLSDRRRPNPKMNR